MVWYVNYTSKKLSLKERGRERALGQIQLTPLRSGLRSFVLDISWDETLEFCHSFVHSVILHEVPTYTTGPALSLRTRQ